MHQLLSVLPAVGFTPADHCLRSAPSNRRDNYLSAQADDGKLQWHDAWKMVMDNNGWFMESFIQEHEMLNNLYATWQARWARMHQDASSNRELGQTLGNCTGIMI